jgi:hypothetical protein
MENRKYIPQATFYTLSGIFSFFLSQKIAEGFGIHTPQIILIFEISSVIVIISLSWFLYFKNRKLRKEKFMMLIKYSLLAFAGFSILFFLFVHLVVIDLSGTEKTIIGGLHGSNNGIWLLSKEEQIKQLSLFANSPEEAFSDHTWIKFFLLLLTLIYISIVTSLFMIVVEFAGLDLEN